MRGLAGALHNQVAAECLWLELAGFWSFFFKLIGRSLVCWQWPRPDFIVAAGRKTHLPLLLLRRLFGGVSVVLMRPSLPLSWFDVAVVPAHDDPPRRENVQLTSGALTDIRVAESADPAEGLILIGGPSAHYGWDADGLLAQLDKLFTAMPRVSWTLTTSRRTPQGLLRQLGPAQFSDLDAITLAPHDQTDRPWLLERFARSGVIWVTEDSVSMIYEALSSGAAVGVLAMPKTSEGRVSRGVNRLLDERQITPLSTLSNDGEMYSAQPPLQEAERIASILVQRYSL